MMIVCLWFSTAQAQTKYPSYPDSLIHKGIDQTFSCQFDSALLTFQNLIDSHPESPSGYLYRALVLRAMMMDFESDQWEEEFYELVDRTIDLGKKEIEEHKNNALTHFYIGGGYFLKGISQAKSGKIIPGVLNARRGLGYLNEVLDRDSTFYDAYIILGNYDYLTGRYYRHVDWLPGISDNRERGIERLKLTIQRGLLSRWAGVISLGWIAYDMENYSLALDLFLSGHQHYPESRFFLWALADTHLKLKQYDDAIWIYQQLFTSVQQQTGNTLYNQLVLHYKMASACMAQQDYSIALEHCEKILENDIDGQIKDQFGSRFDKTKKMRNHCLEQLTSQSDNE
ncbi:hypothetical protein JW824_03640 [bacterium]|nr:hypothetical protein [bacterium]RQV97494.1 MAG: hypothetical protein EH221_03600 [bacterium]